MSRTEPPSSEQVSAGPSGDGMPDPARGRQKAAKTGRLERLTGFVTSLSGLLTGLCAILTAVASVFGIQAHQQASQITTQQADISAQQSHISVQASQLTQQKNQIDSLNQQIAQAASATPSPTPTTTDASTSTAPPLGGQSVYLSTISAVGGQNASAYTGPRLLSAVNYPSSIEFVCGSSGSTVVYPISGFRQLSTTVGIPDDAYNATGVKLSVSITDQDNHKLGSTVTVSLDHPQKITVPVSGEAQITIHCIGSYPANQTVSTYVALGDALLTQ